MTPEAVGRAAEALVGLRRRPGSLSSLPEDCRPASLDEAYDIQDALNAALPGAGFGARAGFKIGCTTKVMQDFLGVDHPCAGGVMAATVHRDAARLPFAAFNHVGVECEIAVTLETAIPARDSSYGRDELAVHVASCHAAMEIGDARFPDFSNVPLATMVADDFYNAGAVIGPAVEDWRNLDLAAVEGRMSVNGAAPATGRGAAVLGHPLAALAWLAKHRSARGQDIPAGSVVLLGSLVQTHWAEPGDEIVCELAGLGTVSAVFEG